MKIFTTYCINFFIRLNTDGICSLFIVTKLSSECKETEEAFGNNMTVELGVFHAILAQGNKHSTVLLPTVTVIIQHTTALNIRRMRIKQ